MKILSFLSSWLNVWLDLSQTDRTTQQDRAGLTAQPSSEETTSVSRSPSIEQEIRAQRRFSLAEAIGREGGGFMKGESAIPRPLRAITAINRFIAAHLSDPNGALSTTLQSWAKEDIRVSRHLDAPLTALAQILESLLSEPTTFQEFFRQVAIAQSKLTGDRPYFQKAGQSPHPDAQYSYAIVQSQLRDLLQSLRKANAV